MYVMVPHHPARCNGDRNKNDDARARLPSQAEHDVAFRVGAQHLEYPAETRTPHPPAETLLVQGSALLVDDKFLLTIGVAHRSGHRDETLPEHRGVRHTFPRQRLLEEGACGGLLLATSPHSNDATTANMLACDDVAATMLKSIRIVPNRRNQHA